MSDKLSPADAKWVKDARAEFIERVDGKEICALRARVAELEARGEMLDGAIKIANYEIESLRSRVAELEAALVEAYGYAKRFLEAFVAKNFPPNPDWRPLPDLVGVLTQIDNASTITRDLRARVAELEAANKTLRDEISQYWEPLALGLSRVR